MIFLLQLLVLGVLGLLGLNLWKTFASGGARIDSDEPRGAPGPIIEGRAETVSSPGEAAAATLRAFENASAAAKAAYPAVFAMLGGYLNAHAIETAGGLEPAVRSMIDDWAGRREEVTTELTKLLADNSGEAAARAIVVAACDADFEREGYRKWLIWLLGRFNAL